MSIVVTLACGAFVGWIMSMLGRSPHGILMDMLFGMVGWVMGKLLITTVTHNSSPATLVLSLFAAVFVIALGRSITRRAY